MAKMEDNKLNYGFTFKKRGLHPEEFKDCLNQKIDKLLEQASLKRVETLKTEAITTVKKLCMRENTTRPGMDNRYRSVQENIHRGLIRHRKDTPMACNKDSSGKQGQEKKQKKWRKDYHEVQHQLFTGPLKQKIKTLSRTIVIKDNGGKRGYLFHSEEKGGQELKAIEFGNVIDGVTYDLLKNLTALKEKKTEPMPDELDFEEVSELSKEIVIGRNAVDWVKNNDLMSENETRIWRDHLIVLMSFAALMAVSLMILSQREKLRKRSKDLIPAFPTVLLFSVTFPCSAKDDLNEYTLIT